MIYLCPVCGARLVLSGPKRPEALARIINAHEESDQHIVAARSSVPLTSEAYKPIENNRGDAHFRTDGSR
jgi:hypothetical protein